MRIASILIACFVLVTLYFFVFDRETLGEVTGKETAAAMISTGGETGSGAPDATQTAENTEDEDDMFAPPAARETDMDEAVKVVAMRSQARQLESAVVLRGQSEAARSVNVAAETAGRVVSDPMRKGAYVDAGQILCELDPGTRETRLAEARASLPTAQARVLEAKARLQEADVALANAKKLAEGGYASDTQVISAEAGVESARAALTSAQAGVDAANAGIASVEKDIENLQVRAPFAGLLESDTAELGTFMNAGAVCATVIQLDPMKLVAFAPEADVDRIEVGTLAGARFLNGDEVSGRVTFLSRSADSQTRTFRVEIEVPNSAFAIRDGQTVEMAIRSEGKDAHLVNQSSLTLNDEGILGLRLVDENNKVAFAPVDVLRDTPEGIWVSGPPQEAQIIIVGQEFVRAGVPVDPHFKEATQ